MRRLDSITDSMDMNLSKFQEPDDLGSIWVPLFCSSYITSLGLIFLICEMGIVKAMVFPVVMYGCKSWTVKKAEH